MEKRLFGALKILEPMNESQSKETPLEVGEARGESISKPYYHQSV
jgi:hypothetical protein